MTSTPEDTSSTTATAVEPLEGLTFTVIGPGRVGSSLAHWLCARGAVLTEVVSRRPRTETLGCLSVLLETMSSDLPDLLLLTVPDQELDRVVDGLAHRSWTSGPTPAVVLHTSGARTSGILAPLHIPTWSTGSLHPLRAFATTLTDPRLATETFFGYDGDPTAEALILRIVSAWTATAARIPPSQRSLYHFAATLAAGGAATLVQSASDLAKELGLPPGVPAGYRSLALGAIRALAESSGEGSGAITGPVARGEATYLERLDELHRAEPNLYPLAVLTALETLRQLDRHSALSAPRTALRDDLIGVCRREGFLDVLLG